MREIKFRGKRTDNGEWIYGHYLEMTLCDGEGRCSYIKIDGHSPIKVIPETVGQYTGLKDKDGKEIYEGDVCEEEKTWVNKGKYFQMDDAFENYKIRGKCEFVGSSFVARYESLDRKGRIIFQTFGLKNSIIIGNIHENPELLTQKQ